MYTDYIHSYLPTRFFIQKDRNEEKSVFSSSLKKATSNATAFTRSSTLFEKYIPQLIANRANVIAIVTPVKRDILGTIFDVICLEIKKRFYDISTFHFLDVENNLKKVIKNEYEKT